MSRIGIAVAGASCSGKTTFANALASELEAPVLRIDDYYRPFDRLTFQERCLVNFDAPSAIDSDLLLRQVRALLEGRPIDAPRYDFTRHARCAGTRKIEPSGILIVEGLFALAYPELVSLCSVRVFVEAPRELCLERRLIRDTTERGRTAEEVAARFTEHVWPMYQQYVLPSRSVATACVSGEHPHGPFLAELAGLRTGGAARAQVAKIG